MIWDMQLREFWCCVEIGQVPPQRRFHSAGRITLLVAAPPPNDCGGRLAERRTGAEFQLQLSIAD